jgi:hypothetical protein
MVLGNIIGGFITVLVGVNLVPVVADQISVATFDQVTNASTNITGVSATLLNLTTVFFALAVMAAGVTITVVSMRNAGVL